MPDPFTIRIFVPDGDPEGVRLIDRMNWTGLGIAFPRSRWMEVRQRSEFKRAGVYILVGYQEDDLPTIYIGQADGVRNRIESHYQNKDFWDWGIIFVSNSPPQLTASNHTAKAASTSCFFRRRLNRSRQFRWQMHHPALCRVHD